MTVLQGGLFFITFFVVTVSSDGDIPKITDLETDQIQDLPRYVVFPGLDAADEEIAEWNVGFASPFNVFFGPKPYVLGWVGEAPFGPVGEEGEEDIEGEEGDLEGEEGGEGDEEGGEGDEEGVDPEYDYEKI